MDVHVFYAQKFVGIQPVSLPSGADRNLSGGMNDFSDRIHFRVRGFIELLFPQILNRRYSIVISVA